mmetsp:Transcript_121327/g.387778  ORF Transcript_121327/g.387778 Transcript_121327/m.387778 type:complete len:344 (+) Transcript_121327:355-1386(+)
MLLADGHPADQVLSNQRFSVLEEAVHAQQRGVKREVVQRVRRRGFAVLPAGHREVPLREGACHGKGVACRQRLNRRSRLNHDGIAPGRTCAWIQRLSIDDAPQPRRDSLRDEQLVGVLGIHPRVGLCLLREDSRCAALGNSDPQGVELIALPENVQVHLPGYEMGVQLCNEIPANAVAPIQPWTCSAMLGPATCGRHLTERRCMVCLRVARELVADMHRAVLGESDLCDVVVVANGAHCTDHQLPRWPTRDTAGEQLSMPPKRALEAIGLEDASKLGGLGLCGISAEGHTRWDHPQAAIQKARPLGAIQAHNEIATETGQRKGLVGVVKLLLCFIARVVRVCI